MSTLTVLAFQSEPEAEQMMGTLKQLQSQKLIKVEDAALLTKENEARLRETLGLQTQLA